MKFIDLPKPVKRAEYDSLKQRLIDKLDLSQVESVYQIGSVGHPGISDLDMVVVFKDQVKCSLNPRLGLGPEDTQILTHSLFAGNVDLFQRSFKYSFFHNYDLLWGKDLRPDTRISEQDLAILKRQIALEYMLKFYSVLGTQKWYGLVKLRTFLLEAKAIAYDLDFLNYEVEHPLRDSINKVITWRDNWFKDGLRPSNKAVSELINRIYREVEVLLNDELKNAPLYFQAESPAKYNLNTSFSNADELNFKPSGLPLSRVFQLDDKRYFNLMHRMNKFSVEIPWTWDKRPDILESRYKFAKEFADYNRNMLPNFSPIVSILKVFS